MSQARSFAGNALDDVIDKGVHNAHGLGRDAGVGVDPLEHLVHADGITLLPALPPLLAVLLLALGHGILGALLVCRCGLGWFRNVFFFFFF
ncbi:unnamed protein product, partial [Staurois parvus]